MWACMRVCHGLVCGSHNIIILHPVPDGDRGVCVALSLPGSTAVQPFPAARAFIVEALPVACSIQGRRLCSPASLIDACDGGLGVGGSLQVCVVDSRGCGARGGSASFVAVYTCRWVYRVVTHHLLALTLVVTWRRLRVSSYRVRRVHRLPAGLAWLR